MAFQKQYLSFGMVAFVDLLGYSDRVRALETPEELIALETQVLRVQKWFQHKPTEELEKQEHKLAAKTVLAFSDCVVVSVPFHSTLAKFQGDFDVMMAEVSSLGMAQGQCAVNGIFVRGGADFGMWYRRGATLISPAMVNAYHLEGAVCVPMIGLTDEFYQHLAQHKHRSFYSKDIDPLRLIRRFEKLPNGSSQWLIDYVPLCLESVDGALSAEEKVEYRDAGPERRDEIMNTAFARDCKDWARWHADEIKKGFAGSDVASVKAKYEWLAQYHDDALGRFFSAPPPEALIGSLA